MPVLLRPTTAVHGSFLVAMDELRAEGWGGEGDSTIDLHLREHGDDWSTLEGFRRYVRWVRMMAEESASRPPGRVPETVLWWVEGTEYLGRIMVRHRLTPRLRETGGTIGYDVRPSARRRGHATAMLRAALPVAADLGFDPVLVTCAADNVASRLTIERNSGELIDRVGDTLRYWVPAG
jgi:predicted acetyltransferase